MLMREMLSYAPMASPVKVLWVGLASPRAAIARTTASVPERCLKQTGLIDKLCGLTGHSFRLRITVYICKIEWTVRKNAA